MKKLFYLFLTLFALGGCDKTDEIDRIMSDNPEASELPQTLCATILNEEDAQDTLQSRTYLNNNRKVVWHADDEISFFLKNTHGRYKSTGQEGDEHVVFEQVSETTVSVANPPQYSLAVYPYDETITCERKGNQDKLHVTYPATQTYAANTFAKGTNLMVSAGTIPDKADNNLRFRNACGYLVLKLYGNNTKVKTITLSSRTGNEKIAGAATIVAKSNAAPVTTMGDDASPTVTLNCGDQGVALGADAAHATEFWFMLPPVTFEGGIKVEVAGANGITYTKETTNTITVSRNSIKPMAALHVENQFSYTTVSGEKLNLNNAFNATIKEHYFDPVKGKFVVSFYDNLTTIKMGAFDYTDIQTVDIPGTVTTIGDNAFKEANYLTELTIPGSVNSIGYDAFDYCTALKRLTLEPSPTKTPLIVYLSVGGAPFYYSPLEYIHVNRQVMERDEYGKDLADDVERVGPFCISEEKQHPQEIIIGEQLEKITYKMFATGFYTTVTIPATVQSIGICAFGLNKKLNTIVIEESTEPIQIQRNITTPRHNTFSSASFTSITLNREVNYIDAKGNDFIPTSADEGLFSIVEEWVPNFDELECTVNIGAKVKNILPYMFGLVQVKTVNIADGIETIGKGAFYECGKLTSISIPGTVKSIGNDAFFECESLSSVTFLPSNKHEKLTLGCHIGYDDVGPFYDSPLAYINIDREIELSAEYKEQLDDWDMGIFANDYYDEDDLTAQVIIGSNVKTIHDWMFNCVRMQHVEIPASVTSIGKEAFAYCYILDEVKLHHTTPPTLGDDVFYKCGVDTENDKLDAIKVPSGSVGAFKSAPNWETYKDIISGWTPQQN